jgi:type I restriction enzyme S subunit
MTSEPDNGPLPKDWEEVSIGDITKLVYRYPTYYGITYVDEGVPEVRGELLLDNGEIESDRRKFRFITEETAKMFPKVRLEPGDIVMSVRGTMGKIGIVREQLRGAVITANLIRLSPQRAMILPDFFRLALLTPEFIQGLNGASPQTTIKTITAPALKDLTLAVPHALPEQQKIATVLGLVQRAIEQQERLIALTTELKKALLHKLFTEGLRGEPQKQTEIGPVPESWEVTRLDNFCVLQRGFDITKKAQVLGDVPVVSSGGIASYHNVAKVKGPGVVVGRKGTLGKVHYLDVDYWPHDTTLWVKDFKGHDPLFTSYFLRTLRFERYNSGASNPTLNRNTVHAELVAYPQKEEQEEIGRILRTVEDKTRVHERKLQTLTDLFRTLLHQLMTAQIRVHELDLDEILPQPTRKTLDKLSSNIEQAGQIAESSSQLVSDR